MRRVFVVIQLAWVLQARANANDVERTGPDCFSTSATLLRARWRLNSVVLPRRLSSLKADIAKIPTAMSSLSLSSSSFLSRRQLLFFEKEYVTAKRNEVLTRIQRVGAESVASNSKLPPKGIEGYVFSLIKNIVGSGVLSLPAGLAAVGPEPTLLLPATTLVITLGVLSSYTFFSVGKQCGIQNVSTYTDAWKKTVGHRSAWIVTTIALMFPVVGCLCYSIIIGDSFSALARSGALGPWLESSPLARDRQTWILSITTTVLYPLCSLTKLGALGYTSLLGTLAVAYTALFMTLRHLDGSYLPGGSFHAALSTLPSLGTGADGILDAFKTCLSRPEIFVFIAICGKAFTAHANAPIYYDEAGRDNARFRLVTGLGYGVSVLFMIVFLVSGFLTFGSSAAGNILNSYAETDRLAAVARALYGLSVVVTYPVVFAGLKPVLRDIFRRLQLLQAIRTNWMFSQIKDFSVLKWIFGHFKKIKDETLLNQMITVFPLAVISATSLFFPNVKVINAVCGAFCGSAFIYILPTLMYLKSQTVKHPVEKAANIGLLVFGVLFLVLGVYTSVMTC